MPDKTQKRIKALLEVLFEQVTEDSISISADRLDVVDPKALVDLSKQTDVVIEDEFEEPVTEDSISISADRLDVVDPKALVDLSKQTDVVIEDEFEEPGEDPIYKHSRGESLEGLSKNVPSAEEVQQFLTRTSNENHYLAQKDPAQWDEYDSNNWEQLTSKAQVNEEDLAHSPEQIKMVLWNIFKQDANSIEVSSSDNKEEYRFVVEPSDTLTMDRAEAIVAELDGTDLFDVTYDNRNRQFDIVHSYMR